MKLLLMWFGLVFSLQGLAQTDIEKSQALLEYHFKNENYKPAITFGKKLVEDGSADDYDHFMLGMSYFYEENFFYAIKHLSRSIEESNKCNEWWSTGERFGLYTDSNGEDFYLKSSNGISLEYKYGYAQVFRGLSKYLSKDYYGAIEDFKMCYELLEEWDLPLKYLGICYYYTDQNNLAMKYLSMAIELYPNFVDGYILRGDLYRLQGKLKESCLDFSSAVNLGSEKAFEMIKEYCN